MIQVTPQMEIWMAVEAVEFRRGIDGLGPGVPGGVEGGSLFGLSVCFPQQARHGYQNSHL